MRVFVVLTSLITGSRLEQDCPFTHPAGQTRTHPKRLGRPGVSGCGAGITPR
nr:MAG TPA: hypothetical protein [Caudoviricetes sp.]